MKKYIIGSAVCLALAGAFASCSSDDDLDPVSIFQPEPDVLDPTSPTYKFDKWVKKNYLDEYNMTFTYRMKSLATDPDYNLVPASLDKSMQLAVLTKYLWYDVYDQITGSTDFLRQYGPKMLHIIGSSAVNPSTGTEILGLAEGGLKVSLFVVNDLDPENAELLNAKYFKTMHHEFSHILHQTKTYPKSFDEINAANYEPNTWQDRLGGTTCSLGFTSPYASGQAREDFAETCANYIVRTPDEWELTLWLADRGWVEVDDSFITYALSDVWPGAFRDLDKTGIDDAVMQKYGFCYYYYRNQSDKDQNRKTYFGQFVEREEVYYLTNLQLTVDATGSCSTPDFEYVNDYFYYIAGGGQKFKKVADFEAWVKNNFTDKGIEIFPAAASEKTEDGGDGRDGRAIILEKVSIARQWFASAWGIDMDALRALVQERQSDIDINELLKQIDDIDKVPDAE
ncbi:substrate import-associated zinc metallohydrolase lipoprotein [Muribaculum intestinale]|uniref:substrate import-associated zinc metallohydrolase lipoprotein n=1 Tax=Muribaculum intestinale TaxID=1796646 RepID=UPI00243253BF|nr:substrate import-associated zinc metallohydrolase lipoprotein [Muribaculum intestinale]